ncbi:MAG TPA: circadian clock KaiB family protein [Rugosibacter sp.]
MKRPALFKFQLYIAGDALNSAQALVNPDALCQAHLAGRHEIEVVDVFKNPRRAIADGIFMTPTLILLAPSPVRRIVGTLSQTQSVLQALGLEGFTP